MRSLLGAVSLVVAALGGCRRPADAPKVSGCDASFTEEVRITMTVLAKDDSAPLLGAGAVPGLDRAGRFRKLAQWNIVAKLGDWVWRALPDGQTIDFVVHRGPFMKELRPGVGWVEDVNVSLRFRDFGMNCISQSFEHPSATGDDLLIAIACDLQKVSPRGEPAFW